MKNFKKIYYIIYLLFCGFLFYLAYDLVNVLDTLKKWGWYTYFSELPIMGSRFIYTVMFLLLFELFYENYNVIRERRKRAGLEKEITSLKARLYDQEHTPKIEPSIDETVPEETVPEETSQEDEKEDSVDDY